MDEKYLEGIFTAYGGADRFGAYGDFKDLMQNNDTYRKDFYNSIGGDTLGEFTDFEDLVKKKDGGTPLPGTGDSLSRSQKAEPSLLESFQSVEGMVSAGMAPPTYLLNRRQLGDFARAGGLVASPENSRQLAQDILAKPVSREEQERDRLIDVVDESFGRIRADETRKLQQNIEGVASQGLETDILQQQLTPEVEAIMQQRGYTDAVGFVDQSLASKDFKSLRDVINNAYGTELTNIDDEKEASRVRKEQQRFNVLLDKMGSAEYALTNPQVIEGYQYDVVGRKEIKDELTPNQYSGLRYLQANNPEMYEQYSMELSKAADPQLFGRRAYDKKNRDYQFMLFNLDKRGSEVNGMAIAEQIRGLAPEKQRIDQEFRGRLSGLSQQMMNATDYDTRKNLQEAVTAVRDEYDTNPTVIRFGALQELANQNEVDFRAKYPDQSSRMRENMVRDILQDDGTGVMGAVGRRVKWLFSNTVTGLANLTGGNEFEFGQSRNYLRNLRKAAEESAELYQPTYNAAVQPLYKLNFSPADYAYINNVRQSEMDEDEQAKLIGDYLENNADRIRYEENPEAGKRNWTWGAIGNQVADVGTQVLYQGGLMMLMGGLGRTATAATAAARTAGAAEAASLLPAAAGGFEAAAENIAAVAVRSSLGGNIGQKLAQLGSIMGSSYVTAYQPAYAEALSQGKTVEEAENYANQIAIVNGLSETISPDALVLKRAASGVKGLSGLITPEAMTTARRLRTSAGYFMKGYVKNVGNETLEEITAAFGEYGVDQLHNMNQDEFNTLSERVKNAAITTAIGMTPFGISAGGATVRRSSRMQKEMFYQAGIYPELVKQEINTLVDGGGISQQEANKRIQMVNTMERIVQQLPPMDNGRPMPDRAKQEYAFNRFQQAVLENDLQNVDDENSSDFLKVQIAEYMEKNRRLLRGLDLDVTPAGTPAASPAAEQAAEVPSPDAAAAEAPAGYQVGQVLDSPQVGDVEIIGRTGDVFNVRTPDGNVEDYTTAEIDEFIRPVAVRQAQQAPAPVESPVPDAAPSIYVQRPAPPEEISSPINTTTDATDQIIQQEGAERQYPQGDQSGQAPEASGGDRLQQPAPDAQQGQVSEPVAAPVEPGAAPALLVEEQAPVAAPVSSTAEPVAAAVPVSEAPVVDEDIAETTEAVEAPAPEIDERMGLSATQAENIERMPVERLYSNIIELDPDSPVRDQAAAYSRRELQGILRGLVARERLEGPRAMPAAPAPAPSPLTGAVQAYNTARQLVERRRTALEQVRAPGSQDYRVKRAFLDQATMGLKKAESAYLAALKDSNRELRQRRRQAPGIAAGRTDAEIIANYIEMAKVYVRQGARTVQQFAEKLGEKVNPHMERGWDIVHSGDAPLQLQGETTKTYLRRLRTWEKEQASSPEVSRRRKTRSAEQAEALRLGVEKLSEGIAVLRRDINTSRQAFNQELGLDPSDYSTYVAALKWNIDNNTIKKRTASAVLKALRQADTRKVVATEMQLLKMQLAERERGSKLGYRSALQDLRGIREQVSSLLSDLAQNDLFRNGTFTEKDLVAMGRQVNRIYNQEGLDRFAGFLDQLINNADLAAVISDIGDLQDQIGKILRKKDAITANMIRKNQLIGNRGVLRGLKNINPLQAEDPAQLRDMLQNVVDSMQGTEILTTSNQDILDYLEADTQRQVEEKATNLKSRYREALDYIGGTLGVAQLPGTRTADQFDQLVDSIVNDPSRSVEQKIRELNALRTAVLAQENQVEQGGELDSIDEVYEQVREGGTARPTTRTHERLTPVVEAGQDFLQIALEASDFNATAQEREWVRSIIAIDPARLTTKQLVLLKNVIDNILLNQDFAGAQAFHVWQNAQQKVGSFLNWTADKGKNLRRDNFQGALGKAFKSLSSSDQIIRTIADNDYDMAVHLMEVTGLGDIKAKHAQAKQLVDREITEPLKKLYKKYKGIRTPESIIKRGMYAYLNENNFGSPQDQQEEFARRKMIVEQDIARKKTSDDPAMEKEVALTEQIYKDNFEQINSQAELQSAGILSEGEKAVYDLFRDFYDRHKEDFRSVVENMLNLPFNDVNNYVKDSYKILEGATADADFTGLGGSAFMNAKDPNSASTATMERNRFTNLDNIAVLDDQGRVANYRVINYAFDTQQLHNATAMTEDIYTLEPRLEAEAALNSEALKQYMGGTNLRMMRDNVENQVRAQQRLIQRDGDSWVGQAGEKLANTLNKVGIRQMLFSLNQLIKQPKDIVVNTMANMGADFPMFFQAMMDFPILVGTDAKPYIRDLLSQSEIALRGKTFGGTNWLSQQALDEIKQEIKGIAKDTELENPDKLAWLIEAPDTYFAKVGWLAYYAQSLKRQGLVEGYNDINWENEARDINREARDYAQIMTSTRLNVNSKESQSEFYAKTAGLGRLFQITFLPLSSFNMNNYALMYGDLRTLSGPGTQEQKRNAIQSLASRALAELAFQTARGYLALLIKAGAAGVQTLFGVEPPPEKDDDEFWWKVGSESIKNIFFGLLGNISSEAAAEFINYLGNKTMDRDLLKTYDQNPNIPGNNFGMFSLFGNSFANMDNYMQRIVNPVDKHGNPIEVSDSEKAIMAFSIAANIAGSLGYMEGDTKRIIDRAARDINMRLSKEAKDPYWVLMNNPESKPRIKFNGQQLEWTDEQLEYYNAQRQYYLEQNKEKKWTDEYKARYATDRAKTDLQKEYKGKLKYKKDE